MVKVKRRSLRVTEMKTAASPNATASKRSSPRLRSIKKSKRETAAALKKAHGSSLDDVNKKGPFKRETKNSAKCDYEIDNADMTKIKGSRRADDEQMKIDEMETQVVTGDFGSGNGGPHTPINEKAIGRKASKSGDSKREADKMTNKSASSMPSSSTDSEKSVSPGSDKENKTNGKLADEKRSEIEDDDEAKTDWLGKAFGLRKSASPETVKAESKIVKLDKVPEKKKIDLKPEKEIIGQVPSLTTSKDLVDLDKEKKVQESNSKTEDEKLLATSVSGASASEKSIVVEPVGKLRSSIADEEGDALARSYRKSLREMDDYSLNFLCQEVHHPVVSCFRDLTRTEVSQIVASGKVRKGLSSLELSVLYLGLIDLIATVNNNPFYGENFNAKFSKNVSGMVQRVLMEFKNIIGMWALHGDEQLRNRYSLVIRYLRVLCPLFKKSAFDKEFSDIIDCIEKEVGRLRSNQEKLRALGDSCPVTTSEKRPANSDTSTASDLQGNDARSALGEIVLNVNLTVKEDVSDDEDEDVTLVEEMEPKIFGKPIKASPSSKLIKKKKRVRKIRGTFIGPNDPFYGPDAVKALMAKKQKSIEVKTPNSELSKHTKSSLPQPKKLATTIQSASASTSGSGSPKTPDVITTFVGNPQPASSKRNATEELTKSGDSNKKLKIDESSPVSRNDKMSIRNFFQSTSTVASSSSPSSVASTTSTSSPSSSSNDKVKPPNAFSIMMNKSREIAKQNKLRLAAQLAAGGRQPIPAVKG